MSLHQIISNARMAVRNGTVDEQEADEAIRRAIAGEAAFMLNVAQPEDTGTIFVYIKNDLAGFYTISDRDLRRIIAQEQANNLSKFYETPTLNSLLFADKELSIEDKLKEHEDLIRDWGGTQSVGFGIKLLDEACGGFFPGEICVVCGGTGGMKTSLALNAVEDFILRDMGHVLYISVDMLPEEIYFRLILRETLDQYSEVELRGLVAADRHEYRAAKRFMLEKYDGKLSVEGHIPRKRIDMGKLRWHIAKQMPDLVIIDYLTMIEHAGKSDLDFVQLAMPEIHGIAQELKIPIMILSQMSRASRAEQATGRMGGHARGGGIVEELATVEIELRREENENSQADIFATVTKTRRGIAGKIFLLDYRGKSMRFTGAASKAERVVAKKPIFKKSESAW